MKTNPPPDKHLLLLKHLGNAQGAAHLVENDVEAFVEAHPRFSQHLRDTSGYTDVGCCTGRQVSLRARATQGRADSMLMTVKNRINGIVDRAQIRGFDLNQIRGSGNCEQVDAACGSGAEEPNSARRISSSIKSGFMLFSELGNHVHDGFY